MKEVFKVSTGCFDYYWVKTNTGHINVFKVPNVRVVQLRRTCCL